MKFSPYVHTAEKSAKMDLISCLQQEGIYQVTSGPGGSELVDELHLVVVSDNAGSQLTGLILDNGTITTYNPNDQAITDELSLYQWTRLQAGLVLGVVPQTET